MFRKWVMPLGLVASACLAALVATAQDGGRKDAGTKDTGAATRDTVRSGTGMGIFTGRIARVDTDKRTIELTAASPAGGTGKAVGTEPGPDGRRDTSGSGKDAGRRDPKDAGKAVGGVPERRTMTFQLSERARITVDGKEATFRDLKLNAYARVHTTVGGTGGKDKDAGGKGTGGATSATMIADRVEMFTRDLGSSDRATDR
jgi:hypothetical protein